MKGIHRYIGRRYMSIAGSPAMDMYLPPVDQQQDIVDVVCRIMEDDGPLPMRNNRPAQKQLTAADQFHLDHQRSYEAPGRQSRGRLDAVHTYNSGYPKMHDELRKRRSVGKIIALPAQRDTTTQQAAYSRANNCIKNTKKVKRNKRNIAPKCRSYNVERNMRSRQAHPKIVKQRSRKVRDRNTNRIYRFSKLRMNRGCQYFTHCLAEDKQSASTDNVTQMLCLDNKMGADGSLQCRDDISKSTTEEGCKPEFPSDTSQSTDDNDDKSKCNNLATDASVASMSSYHSYASLDHEPMV